MMPPRIRSQHAVCVRSKLSACQILPHHQNLSTTTALRLAAIPPESPNFIDVPQSRQQQAIVPRPVKGTLPVPRRIFPYIPTPTSIDKTSAAYLLAVTPAPAPKGPPPPFTDPTTAAFISWKARQAEARRRNLREGLVELAHRKKVSDGIRNRRAIKRQDERERLVHMPTREDDRLTSPTTLQSQLPARLRARSKPSPIPDPDRTKRLESSTKATARHEGARREERKDQLHTLYTNASTFITNEAQLNAVVEKVFEDQEQFKSMDNYGENVWNLGYQTTVQEMLEDVNQGDRAMDAGRRGRLVKERYKRIAEVLTGGRM